MSKSRSFVFTLNNYTADEVLCVKEWDCKYLIFGKEVGESGTLHLQGYVSFANAKTLAVLKKKYSATAHWEIALGTPKQASDYCSKDGDVFEKGTRPLSQVEKGAGEKERWAISLLAVEEKRYEDIDPQMLVQHLKQLEYAVQRKRQMKRKLETIDSDEMPNEWFVGPPGCGKSRAAREDNPGFFLKDPETPWWDAYDHEDVVIIDDFDKFQVKQGGQMKRLADRYPFQAQVKGGYMTIRPKKVIVTSNYTIEEIWDDPQTVAAIKRRFVIRTAFSGSPTIDKPVYPLFVPGFNPA